MISRGALHDWDPTTPERTALGYCDRYELDSDHTKSMCGHPGHHLCVRVAAEFAYFSTS